MSNKIKIIKDQAETVAKVEGIDVNPIPLNSYTCSIAASNGGITILNPNAPNENGDPTKIMSNVPFTDFLKSDGSTPVSAADLKADIDAQLVQAAPTDVAAGYKGLWDASTNTPDLTDSYNTGDWFFVGTAGTYLGVDYDVNDQIKYNGTSFDLIENPNIRIDTILDSSLSEFDIYVDADYTGSISTGSALQPYTDIAVAIAASNSGDAILVKGSCVVSSVITLPHSLDFYGTNDAEIKYATFNAANDDIIYFEGNGTQKITFSDITFRGGKYAIIVKKTDVFELRNCEFYNNGFSGNGISTVLPESAGGVLGYDSSQVDLQAFYAGAEASNGGAVRVEECRRPLIRECRAEGNLRGFRLQDCGINGGGFVIENQAIGNIESGFYLAGGALNGCQNITVAVNYSAFNANNGLLVIGGLNNKFSQNEVRGNWNAGLCSWATANLTLRDCGLYDNNRSAFNGIGNNGDAMASIQLSDASSYLASTITFNPNYKFLAEVLDTQVHYTNLGANTQKIGFLIGVEMGAIPNDDKNIIKVDDVGFIGQDYAIDLSLVDVTNLRVSLGDNSYQNIGVKSVREPLEGNYFELPFSNHSMNINEADISVTLTGNLVIREGVNGTRLNPYSVNELRAEPYGADIQFLLKDSRKIQFIVPISGITINGTHVNSIQNEALLQINNFITNTTGFSTGGDPVVGFALNNNDLTITLQSGTSYTVDVTTLGVDENKFVEDFELVGSNLVLTMNDGVTTHTVSVLNMINGSQLPAISNNWFIAYGNNAGDQVVNPTVVSSLQNKQPFYNGDFLEKGEEYIWTYNSAGYSVLGVYAGPASTTDEGVVFQDTSWTCNFKFVNNTVSASSVAVDVGSNYASGYAISSGTSLLALAYDTDNKLKLYDISNGNKVLIGQSNSPLVGDSVTIFFGGENQPNAAFPNMVKRYADWTIVHDFDSSETSISDGVEEDTILKSNLSISPGEKMLLNLNYFGRNESIGIGYSGPSSGLSNAPTTIDSRLFYNSAELIRAVFGGATGGIWTWNTSASKYYDPNGDGSNVGYLNGTGLNLGLVSFRYQSNNILEFWHETNNEKIATLTAPLDGFDINIYVGFSEAHPSNRIPSISKQTIGQGPQPITTFAPDISDQSFDITEGAAFNVQIALDANSDIVNQYVEEDAPSWAILNQTTGVFSGTAPAYTGSTDTYVISCKAGNAVGGITTFNITLNVQEIVYTNTKSLKFADGVNSYLGGNAALITSMERSANGSGASDAWSLSLWIKGSTANSGQTIFYFGANDVVNNGHVELRQTNHNGLKRLRLRYGTNGNHLQFTTPSGSITPSSFQHVLVTYSGGQTGVASGSMSTYYGAFKIYIDGVLQTTSNTHSNFGYSGSVVGQNYRFGRFASGTYPKDMLYNQMAIWGSDQSANISDIYNGGNTQDLSLLTTPPDHYYEIESSVTTIQDLIGTAHLVGYNFVSSDLVNDVP